MLETAVHTKYRFENTHNFIYVQAHCSRDRKTTQSNLLVLAKKSVYAKYNSAVNCNCSKDDVAEAWLIVELWWENIHDTLYFYRTCINLVYAELFIELQRKNKNT